MQVANDQEEMNLFDHVLIASDIVWKSIESDQGAASLLRNARRAIHSSSGIEAPGEATSEFIQAMSTLVAFSEIMDVRLYAIGRPQDFGLNLTLGAPGELVQVQRVMVPQEGNANHRRLSPRAVR